MIGNISNLIALVGNCDFDDLLEDVQHANNVGMMAKGAQENYLTVGALCICLVPKSIVDLFECNGVLFPLIRCLPHNAVGALAQALLSNVKAINQSIDEKIPKNDTHLAHFKESLYIVIELVYASLLGV